MSTSSSSGEQKPHLLPSQYTEQCDWGGLLYPLQDLYSFIEAVENIFTECFSILELHTNSICDVVALVKSNFLCSNSVGCNAYKEEVSMRIVSFYVLT